MQPPLPSPTPTWHNDTYPAISPTNPKLSAKGKTVVISGAGSGIGRETALAFAAAGAAKLVLLGRREDKLKETQAKIGSSLAVLTKTVDVVNYDALSEVASSVGSWDVLILSAGYQPISTQFKDFDLQEWWKPFEVNVKGSFLAVRAFLPTAATDATILGVTTGGITTPASTLPGLSAYISSKLALAKLFEFIAAENPHVFAASVHPGCVMTDMFPRGGLDPSQMPMDTVQLPAHFLLWMSGPEARFLKGRAVWANWDVEELKGKEEKIVQGLEHLPGLIGFPYSPTA